MARRPVHLVHPRRRRGSAGAGSGRQHLRTGLGPGRHAPQGLGVAGRHHRQPDPAHRVPLRPVRRGGHREPAGPGRSTAHVHRRVRLRLAAVAPGQGRAARPAGHRRQHGHLAAVGRLEGPHRDRGRHGHRHRGPHPAVQRPGILRARVGGRLDLRRLADRDLRDGPGLGGVLAGLGGRRRRGRPAAVQRRLLRQCLHVPVLRRVHPGRVLRLGPRQGTQKPEVETLIPDPTVRPAAQDPVPTPVHTP